VTAVVTDRQLWSYCYPSTEMQQAVYRSGSNFTKKEDTRNDYAISWQVKL